MALHQLPPSKQTYSLVQCNVRSLHKNIDNLCFFLATNSSQFDFVAVSETWLNPGEVENIPGYSFFSRPRLSRTRGGGVGLLTKRDIECSVDPQFSYSFSYEFDFLVVKTTTVTIVVVYRAPNQNTDNFLHHFEALLLHLTSSNRKIAICGDFNICSINNPNHEYFTLISSYGFHNVIMTPTRVTSSSSASIDHILCNFDTSTSTCLVCDTVISDHCPTIILFPREHTPANKLRATIKKLILKF